jgi:hypothetical protein
MDKKFFFLISLFFVAFALFSITAIRQSSLVTFIRAKEESTPSPEKSVLVAWPLTVNLSNDNQSKITVFVRSNKEIPVPNVAVRLITDFGTYSPEEAYTDKNGKVEFIIKSDTSGNANISAILNNTTRINQKVNVKFE